MLSLSSSRTGSSDSLPLYKLQIRKCSSYFSGVVLGKPWTWIENASDPIDPKLIDPQHKNLGLVGYCIDLVKEFSERIGFDYELVISDGLGKKDKDSGMWTGKSV